MNQLKDYCDYLVEIQDEFDVTTLIEETSRVLELVEAHQPTHRRGWVVALAAAAFVFLLVGGIGFVVNLDQPGDTSAEQGEPEVPPVVEPVEPEEPPVEEEPLVETDSGPELPWLTEDIPPDAESGAFDTPLGLVSWVRLPIDEDNAPIARCYVFDEGRDEDDGYGGCQVADVMSWQSGFASFQSSVGGYPPPAMPEVPTRFWVSTDGLNWREESLPSDPWARGVSLTLDNDVYWLMSEEPAGLWYTTDGSTWHEIDPSGLAPPRSVGPTWLVGYSAPVTAGDLTLSSGEFYNEGDDRFEQSLYIISDNGVTRTEVPWPDADIANLVSAGDWIYAYTSKLRSDDETMTVWRTTDGLSWAEIEPPGFVEEEPVELPPLPSGERANLDGSYEASPVLLDTGWFANSGWKGSSRDGDTWWMKTGDSWFPLTEELDLSGFPMGASGVGQTTFFSTETTLWVMSLNATD